MPRYISLLRFTEKGSSSIKQSTSRARAFARAIAKSGVKVEQQYWTLGQYDGVLVLQADNQEQAVHGLTLLSAAGFCRTETLIAFNDEEFDNIAGA